MRLKIIITFFALVVGGAAGYLLGAEGSALPSDCAADPAAIMKESSVAMMDASQKMTAVAALLKERGEKYNDEDLVNQGEETERTAELIQGKANELMEKGDSMLGAADGVSQTSE